MLRLQNPAVLQVLKKDVADDPPAAFTRPGHQRMLLRARNLPATAVGYAVFHLAAI